MSESSYSLSVNKANSGLRLDIFVVDSISSLTRQRVQSLVQDGVVLVNGFNRKSSYRLTEGDMVTVEVPEPVPVSLVPENIPLHILGEDKDIIVIVKPPGLVVHPAAGNFEHTLVHGLLYHCHDLSGIGGELRPGIVHRLDKYTSGVMVAAKNDMAHQSLVDQFRERRVEKIYHAIVAGTFADAQGVIEEPIGRHPVQRKKMTVLEGGGRHAVTHWRVHSTYGEYSLVELRLETGRTHQIRVHMAHLGCPVVGDQVYGGRKARQLSWVKRQCLHSSSLTFSHPRTGKMESYTAPLWSDMERVLDRLRTEQIK